ncbi:MAG: cytochrome c peroxidase [Thermodesulfovibrionales bacterium]
MKRSRIIIIIFYIIFSFSTVSYAKVLKPIDKIPIPRDNPQTTEKIELGKKLFFDRRLSGDGTMSCATCHIPDMAFTDGQAISLSYPTTKNWRNTPTLINIAFHKSLFWDGRSRSLEDQALFPVMSSFEMNLNLDYMEEKIRQVPYYRETFKRIFQEDVNKNNIAKALAAFQRSLISKNAPIDRFLKGDKNALSTQAKKGYEIFTTKGGCIKCHHGEALMDQKFHALFVPQKEEHINDPLIEITRRFVAKQHNFKDYKTLKEDVGRYLITKKKQDWMAFKTPSLREVAKTAPYMHNGYFDSLDDVIDFFDIGGGKGNKVLKPLKLTKEEKENLKVFLIEALSSDDIKIIHPEIP